MRIKITYFTGSGNTELVTSKIAEGFAAYHEVETIAVNKIINDVDIGFNDSDVLGLGYPVYDYKPPNVIFDLIDKLKINNKPKPTFLFSTYTSKPLDCNSHLIELLRKKNYYVITQNNFQSPGASAFLYGNTNLKVVKDCMRFENNIDSKIKKFTLDILNLLEKFKDSTFHIAPDFNRFNKIHQRLSKVLYGTLFYMNLKVNDNCSLCGKCTKTCIDSNLQIEDGNLKIKSKNHCSKCLRCVVNCQKKAINFTSSGRKSDYNKSEIISCYKKSTKVLV
ncbi:MAG: EFR1 family ferrodoxin [Spirochaetaceae bacterium]